MGDFFSNLIQDSDANGVKYLIPWLIFCALAIAIPAYYAFEGRKRFVGGHALNKWALDRFFNQLWPLGLVGLIMIGAVYANAALFSWPLWHLLWALWALGLLGYWAYYFAFTYREHLAAYRHHRTQQRYMPPPRAKRASAR